MKKIIEYAIRETPKGYQLCEVETKQCFHGELRNFSRSFELIYKNKEFAIKKADSFFKKLYSNSNVIPVFIGVITNNEYIGEKVNQ
jgi:hypothetical protein